MVESLKEIAWTRPVTPIDVLTAMQEAGVPEDLIVQVMERTAPNLPEDAIRARDACEKYGIDSALLSYWCNKNLVWSHQFTRKLTYVSENDVRERVAALREKQGARS